jgi:tetratricopeptide (TPR) repeat protein
MRKTIETPLDQYIDHVKIDKDEEIIELVMEKLFGFEYYYNEAKLFYNNNNPIVAYRSIKKAMELAESEEQFMLGSKLIGEILSSVGYFEEAFPFFEESLELSKKLEDAGMQAMIIISMAKAYSEKGELDKSISCYEKGLQLYNRLGYPVNNGIEEVGEVFEIATAYNNIAVIYNKKGQHLKAIEYLKKAIEVSSKYSYIDLKKVILYKLNLGYAYMQCKDYDNAEKYMLEALKDSKQINDEHREAKSYRYLGTLYKEKGDTEKAVKYYKKAYKLLRLINKKEEANKILKEIEDLNKNKKRKKIDGSNIG